MCAACVAQGVTYVGGALAGLQAMSMRARARRRRSEEAPADDGLTTPDEPQPDSEAERQLDHASV
jgi:hypothetical protein